MHLNKNDLKNKEMIVYCLIYPILTMTLFMLWIFQSTLPGGDIGMAPLLVGLVLWIVFGIEILLILILRKHLTSMRSKIISLLVGFLLYECTMLVFGGDIVIFDSFQRPFLEDSDMAFSFSSVFSLLIILGLMLINWRMKQKKTLHNNL